MTRIRQIGKSAIVVCSQAFAVLAKGQARVNGVPDLPLVIVTHPLGGMARSVVDQRVEQAVPQVLAHLKAIFQP